MLEINNLLKKLNKGVKRIINLFNAGKFVDDLFNKLIFEVIEANIVFLKRDEMNNFSEKNGNGREKYIFFVNFEVDIKIKLLAKV